MRDDLEKYNQTRLVVTCGRLGTGKSLSALTLGYVLKGEDFKPDKHVAHGSSDQFVKIMKKSKPGDFIVYDEVGVGMDSRQWYSKRNIIMSQVFQTCRTRNLFIVFTTPSFDFVDVKVRKLFHNFVKMYDKNKLLYRKNQAKARWYEIVTNSWSGDFYPKKMSVNLNGRISELDWIYYNKPPAHICEAYEKSRKKMADKREKKAEQFFRGAGDKSVTVEQAAKLLELPDSSQLYQLIRDGKILIDRESNGLKIPLVVVKDLWKKNKKWILSAKAAKESS